MKIYKIPSDLSCIIFDIDSTLYTHELYAHEQIAVQLRHFAKLRNETYETTRAMVESHREDHVKRHNRKISLGNALIHFGVPISESIRWREMLIEPADYLVPDQRLQDTLELLSRKFTLIAVTNNPVLPARKTLEALGVARYFPDCVGLDTTGVSKPHTLPFTTAAELTRTRHDQCLSVGDRYDIDISLPLELGMGGVLVDGVEDVYLLPELLIRL